jgi:polyphosphate kinase
MIRNLDHRVEASCPIFDEGIKKELKEIINIQLHDNVKARSLNNELNNEHVQADGIKIRSQVETYNFLHSKIEEQIEISSD